MGLPHGPSCGYVAHRMRHLADDLGEAIGQRLCDVPGDIELGRELLLWRWLRPSPTAAAVWWWAGSLNKSSVWASWKLSRQNS